MVVTNLTINYFLENNDSVNSITLWFLMSLSMCMAVKYYAVCNTHVCKLCMCHTEKIATIVNNDVI